MSPSREPLFLARQIYRRRRVADAARLVPVVGALLFLVPILAANSDDGASSARGGLYVFTVWAGLIVVAAVLSRPLSRRDSETGRDIIGNDSKGTRP